MAEQLTINGIRRMPDGRVVVRFPDGATGHWGSVRLLKDWLQEPHAHKPQDELLAELIRDALLVNGNLDQGTTRDRLRTVTRNVVVT